MKRAGSPPTRRPARIDILPGSHLVAVDGAWCAELHVRAGQFRLVTTASDPLPSAAAERAVARAWLGLLDAAVDTNTPPRDGATVRGLN